MGGGGTAITKRITQAVSLCRGNLNRACPVATIPSTRHGQWFTSSMGCCRLSAKTVAVVPKFVPIIRGYWLSDVVSV